MKRISIWAVACLCLFGFVGAAQAEEPLRVAIEGAFPPFSYIAPDGLQGFDVDIAHALCEALERPCELKQQPWDGMIPGLRAQKYDAIVASMSITKERQKLVDFTRPYWFAASRFIGLKDTFEGDSPADFAGKTIGVQRGSIQDDYISAMYSDVDLRRYESQDDALLDLTSRRLDAVLAPSISVLDFLASEDGKAFDFFGKEHSDPAYFGIGAGIAVRKGDKALKEALNDALERLMSDGRYKAINAKYFAESIAP
ncbi:transporter substrate-binding domain-containing protein [Aestuariispira ectoiniformans]|uniref:transporter substrate-binding domain-containing protein n=1 Tax=Aestuariispira ectoiniformans TaxID=2775080 RepID=UPI00223AD1C2|nr:transporter substrate-binding domain-containing protein [Aestuariispira ectoiniformans]